MTGFPPKVLLIIAITLQLLLTNCTVVNVHTKHDITTHRKFGFISVLDMSESSASIDTRFAGLGFVNNHLVLGLQQSSEMYFSNDQCAIFIDENSRIDLGLLSSLQDLNCHWIEMKSKGKSNGAD